MKGKFTPPTTSLAPGVALREREPTQRAGEAPAAARKARILVVDADQSMRRSMGIRLGDANYSVQSVGSAQAALDSCVRCRPNVVLTDLRLRDMGGIAFLKELKSRWPLLSVIVLTGYGTIPEAVEATQCGAFGYLIKPIAREELLGQVKRAIAASSFGADESDWRAKIVSRSQLMEDRLSVANRAAGCDLPVLLTGENGTGKELLARAIHAASRRRAAPFVVLDCKDRQRRAIGGRAVGRRNAGLGIAPRTGRHSVCRRNRRIAIRSPGRPKPRDSRHAPRTSPAAQTAKPTGARQNARLICATSHDLQVLVRGGAFFSRSPGTGQHPANRDSAAGPPSRGHPASGFALFGTGD